MTDIFKNKMRCAIFFLFCGIPGIGLVILSYILLAIFALLTEGAFTLFILAIVSFTIGVFLSLLGVGKLCEWLYGLVFLAFPVSLGLFVLFIRTCLSDSINSDLFVVIVIAALIIFTSSLPFLVFRAVEKYYRTLSNNTDMV